MYWWLVSKEKRIEFPLKLVKKSSTFPIEEEVIPFVLITGEKIKLLKCLLMLLARVEKDFLPFFKDNLSIGCSW